MKRSWWSLVLLLFAVPGDATGQAPDLAVSLGAFNISKSAKRAEMGVEIRGFTVPGKLRLVGGIATTTDRSVWAYSGLRRDFALPGRWLFSPAFGMALYEPGHGKDLGGPVAFRTVLEVGREIGQHRRLAVAFYHLSNAGLYDRNPGSNSLIVTFSAPLW